MSFINHFDRVRIINVASRSDRRDETNSEFKRHNFEINTDKVRYFDAITPKESGGFPNPGVRGCYLSHLGVLEEARAAGARNVLILEDDIQFSTQLPKYGPSLFEKLNEIDWDIAYFGHTQKDSKGEVVWKKVQKPMLLAHFYAVNGKAFESLLASLHQILERPPGHPEGGPMHYDGALNTFMQQNKEIKAYYCSINLGYQRFSRTDLHALSVLDTNIFLKHPIKIVRQLRNRILQYVR